MSMSVSEKSAVRSTLYSQIENLLRTNSPEVIDTEPISTGLLAHLENGAFVEIKVTVKDEGKFDLTKTRAAYQEKVAKRIEAMEKKAEKEAEKLAKAKAKAEKA